MPRRHLPSLERLRALREVAQTGGFSAAAGLLGLTQPAVSNQIRQLEAEVGVRLLERIGKRARPTPEGCVLLAAAGRAVAALEAGLDEIARTRDALTGTLVLATGATATKHLLPPVAAALRARHPGIDLSILTGNTADFLPGLVAGSIDLGLLTAPVRAPQLRSRFFFRDRLVCIAPAAAAPPRRPVRPGDLEGRQLVVFERGGSIRRAIDRWLAAADRGRMRVTDIGSADAQVAFVAAGFGWSIISEIVTREAAAAGQVVVRALSPALSRDLVLVWHASRAKRPVIAAALEVFAAQAGAA